MATITQARLAVARVKAKGLNGETRWAKRRRVFSEGLQMLPSRDDECRFFTRAEARAMLWKRIAQRQHWIFLASNPDKIQVVEMNSSAVPESTPIDFELGIIEPSWAALLGGTDRTCGTAIGIVHRRHLSPALCRQVVKWLSGRQFTLEEMERTDVIYLDAKPDRLRERFERWLHQVVPTAG